MTIKRLILPSLVCAALLSACATQEQHTTAAPVVASVDAALTAADTALRAGNTDKAFALLKDATTAFPTDKGPWLRMAQLRFDSNNYGEAIVNALEALARDPDDMLAHSIVAVSGLRVSSKALADLTHKNNLSGTVRSEAQDLAKLLRASLGEEVLVPTASRSAHAAPPRKAEKSAPPAKQAAGSDPFGALK